MLAFNSVDCCGGSVDRVLALSFGDAESAFEVLVVSFAPDVLVEVTSEAGCEVASPFDENVFLSDVLVSDLIAGTPAVNMVVPSTFVDLRSVSEVLVLSCVSGTMTDAKWVLASALVESGSTLFKEAEGERMG